MDLRAWSAALKKSDEGMTLLGQELSSALDQVAFYKTAHRDLEHTLEEVRTENVQLYDKCQKALADAGRDHGEVEQLRKEVLRLNEELGRARDEADRRVFTAYNAFPLTSDRVILAHAYRNKLI